MLLRHAVKRILLTIPLLIGISMLSFGILHLAPGDPVQAEQAMNPKMTADAIRALKALYGLDQPLGAQYAAWLKRLARLDLGNSFRDQRKVTDKIWAALPATLLLNCLALTIVFGVGIPLGIFSAANPESRLDRAFTSFSFIAYSMPSFWLALLLQLVFGVWLGVVPISGYSSVMGGEGGVLGGLADVLWHLLLPLTVSCFGAWAAISRYMRNSMLEVLSQDFVRTARAKGLAERQVLWRHAVPNALLPMVTILGLAVPGLISGSVIIETIFAWPGMGRLAWEAATGYDYPVVMGLTVFGAVLTLAGNLAADLSYAWLDPRIRF